MKYLRHVPGCTFPAATDRRFHLSGGVLGLRLQVDGRRVLHNPLHRHLDKLVKRVQLLADQALLVEVGVDDDPAGLLPQLRGDLLLVLILVQV